MGSLMLFVEETGHYPNCLGKGGGLARNGDEEVSGGGENVVGKGMMELLQAMSQLGRLIKKDIVAGREDENRRERLQSGVAGQAYGNERVVVLPLGISLVESLQEFCIIAITLAVLAPRMAATGEEFGHRIDGNHTIHTRHGEGCSKSQVSARAVTTHRDAGGIASPLGSMSTKVGESLLTVGKRRGERGSRSE